MKKLLLIPILMLSQAAMALDNKQKEEALDKCFKNNTCEITMGSWIVAPGQMNIYIKKDLLKKINDNTFIVNYFGKILKEKRTDPMALIRLDRNLSKADHNAPIYKNEKFLNNLRKSNEIILFEYDPEKIILKKTLD